MQSYREQPFLDYFERLRSIGMTDDEIKDRLPQLQKYYYEMVVKGVFYVNMPTLEEAFINWKTPF